MVAFLEHTDATKIIKVFNSDMQPSTQTSLLPTQEHRCEEQRQRNSEEGRSNVEEPVWRHWEETQGDHGKEEAGVVTS